MVVVSSVTIGVALSWDGGNTYTSEKTTTFTLSNDQYPNFVIKTLGDETDTWGRTWSQEDFSNDNFRVKIRMISKTGSAIGVAMDYVRATLAYDENNIKCGGNVKTKKVVLT